ncbi:MAG: hypothetical protein LZF86_140070 [Nitrospira sp.]|nr:MAG: hypothetical protein LZF86_140070 [Nitrospira sp.]
MNLIVVIVGVVADRDQYRGWSRSRYVSTILFHDGVLKMTAIHAAQDTDPHVTGCAVEIH